MEGGGTQTSDFQLSDIGNYRDVDDIYIIGSSSIFTLLLFTIATRLGNFGGLTLNTYFDMFGMEGVLSNTMMLMLVLQATRYIYTIYYSSSDKSWSPFVFLCIILVIQAIYNAILYFGVINVLPSGKNDMIDIIKEYIKENNTNVIIGQSVLLLFTAIVAMIMKDMGTIQLFIITSLVLYTFPFILAFVSKKPPPPPPPPKKEALRDYRGY